MTRAAEDLHLSQSAVSWEIKRLEERGGRPLLIRDGRTLRSTRDCRALLIDARAIVEVHDRVASRLESSELTGTVRLGSNEEVDPARMARLLGRFKVAHPGATIEFVIDHPEYLAAQIDSGELDVAIVQVIEEMVRPSDTVLWIDRLMWMTSAECRHESKEILPLITFGEHCFYRSVSEPSLDEAGIGHNIVFSASSISGVAQRLRRGSASALSAHVTSTTTTSSRCRGHDPFPTCQ
ncbi:MAG: DNA-binding transcriptional LysR family regulator [Candidatus Aldehydirespiratoraceae bacterium]|jgi:DNA-binding transcriptional LysR family regulator